MWELVSDSFSFSHSMWHMTYVLNTSTSKKKKKHHLYQFSWKFNKISAQVLLNVKNTEKIVPSWNSHSKRNPVRWVEYTRANWNFEQDGKRIRLLSLLARTKVFCHSGQISKELIALLKLHWVFLASFKHQVIASLDWFFSLVFKILDFLCS